ncbi:MULTISPECIES: hypothetical protein [unclassified Listeria]|uniref:hypothetical protein n=1 Tax=unclassified Listeria TaxID=2642072 RepID=UPI000B5900F0|nr:MULTISPECIES: hypothetical protein [unclassified Listeria]
MKKFISILMMSLFLLTACSNNDAVNYLVLDGSITDASEITSRNQITASGILTWQGAAENDSSNVVFTFNSSTSIVNESGKTMESTDLQKGTKFQAVFPEGVKLVAPSPGTISAPATKIIVKD